MVCCTYNFQLYETFNNLGLFLNLMLLMVLVFYIYNLVVCNNSTHHNSFFLAIDVKLQ